MRHVGQSNYNFPSSAHGATLGRAKTKWTRDHVHMDATWISITATLALPAVAAAGARSRKSTALDPGSLLGNGIELALAAGAVRPCVRWAIQSLVDKGLLVRRRGAGTQVVHEIRRPWNFGNLFDDLEALSQRPARRSGQHRRPGHRGDRRRARRRRGQRRAPHRAAAADARRTDGVPVQLPPASSTTGQLEAGLYRLMRRGITLRSARRSGARRTTE